MFGAVSSPNLVERTKLVLPTNAANQTGTADREPPYLVQFGSYQTGTPVSRVTAHSGDEHLVRGGTNESSDVGEI